MTSLSTPLGPLEYYQPASSTGRILYRIPASTGLIDESALQALQTKAGFDPRGYGFYGPEFTVDEEGSIWIQWTSSANCE